MEDTLDSFTTQHDVIRIDSEKVLLNKNVSQAVLDKLNQHLSAAIPFKTRRPKIIAIEKQSAPIKGQRWACLTIKGEGVVRSTKYDVVMTTVLRPRQLCLFTDPLWTHIIYNQDLWIEPLSRETELVVALFRQDLTLP